MAGFLCQQYFSKKAKKFNHWAARNFYAIIVKRGAAHLSRQAAPQRPAVFTSSTLYQEPHYDSNRAVKASSPPAKAQPAAAFAAGRSSPPLDLPVCQRLGRLVCPNRLSSAVLPAVGHHRPGTLLSGRAAHCGRRGGRLCFSLPAPFGAPSNIRYSGGASWAPPPSIWEQRPPSSFSSSCCSAASTIPAHPFSEKSGLTVRPSSAEELSALCQELIQEANRLRADLPEDENGVFCLSQSIRQTGELCRQAFLALAEEYPALEGGTVPHPKPILLSRLFSYTNITGVYVPLTMEANVNVDIPDAELPATMCHELSHLRGYMRGGRG